MATTHIGGEISLPTSKPTNNTTPSSPEIAISIPPSTEKTPTGMAPFSSFYSESTESRDVADVKSVCASPDVTPKFSPSPNKPPLYPTGGGPAALMRRRSFNAKPRSRFGEPAVPIDSQALENFGFQTMPQSPQSSIASSSAGSERGSIAQGKPKVVSGRKGEAKEGPDEKDIYKRVTAQLSARNQRRMTIKLVIEMLVFLIILSCLIASLTSKRFKGHFIYGLEIWKWFLLLMVIFSGMLVTHWFVHFIVFCIEWKFLLKKNVVYFTHGLKTSVEVFIWLGVVLGTWILLFKPGVEITRHSKKILDFVTWSLASLLIGSFLWLIKTTLLKLLASSFHLNRFFDRIQETVFHHYVLQTLSGRPVMELAQKIRRVDSHQVSFTEHSKAHKEKKVVDWDKLHQMKQERVPAWTMKLLVDVVSNSGLSTMSGMLGRDVVEGGVELDDDEITSEEEAIATGVRIFENVVKDKEDPSYIDKKDLYRFMMQEEVVLVYPLFEVNASGQISLKAFCQWVVKVHKDRQALQHALNDNKTAIKQLNKILIAILIVISIIIWLLLTEIATTKLLLFFSSQLVVAAFIFGNTCRTIFESIIFVFVMHPFDVGDRCVIDKTVMVVEEMNILTTVFLKVDKEKVYYPNSVLATKPIGNFFRSPDQGDSLEFAIDFRTRLSKIGELKNMIKKYLEANPHFWHPDHNVVVKEIENVNNIKMVLFFNHTMNFQEFPEKSRRRSELVLEMKRIFEDLDIRYNLLPQEVLLGNAAPTVSGSVHG